MIADNIQPVVLDMVSRSKLQHFEVILKAIVDPKMGQLLLDGTVAMSAFV